MTTPQSDNWKSSTRAIGQHPENPAIGILMTNENTDAVVRVMLRARQHGLPVLITPRNNPSLETISFARELGGRIVEPKPSDSSDHSPETVLSKHARQAGFSGLIIHHNVDEYIDYDRSISTLENAESYSINAVVKSSAGHARTLVAIPAYNEGKTIATVVSKARRYVDEVLVVDDGSDDNTREHAREAGAIVFEHRRNQGYGATLKTIFREASQRGLDHLIILDGDGQHNPDDIPRLLETQRESNAELVIGSRFEDEVGTEMPTYRTVGLWIVNVLTNIGLGTVRRESRIRDTQSGFRAYNAEAIQTLALDNSIGSSMGASTDILFHARDQGYRIAEVSTQINYDVENGSSQGALSHGYDLIRNIFETVEYRRPLTFLGIPGIGSLLVGFGVLYWTITNYIQTATFPIGIVLVSISLITLGVFSIFTAIILHSLKLNSIYDAYRGGRL